MILDKIRYRLVYNRTGKVNRNGKALVQVEARLHGRKKLFTTNVYLFPHQWQNGLVVNHPNAAELNAMLLEAITRVEGIEIGLWKRGVKPTLSLIKDAVLNDETPNMTFTDFAEKVIERDHNRKESTKEIYRNSIDTLKQFRRLITFDDLTRDFVEAYEKWLTYEKKCAPNTVIKHLRALKAMINEAVRRRYVKRDDFCFNDVKIKSMQRKAVYLTKEEVAKVEAYYQRRTCKHRSIVRAMLFLIYTGLRFSDLKDLKREHLQTLKRKLWLIKTMVKTGTEIRLPIYLLFGGKAIKLIDDAGGVENIAKVGHNSTMNRAIKEIVTDIGIEKEVTAHVCRHAFATCLLQDGVPITTVQRLCGHNKLETTQIYADVVDDTVVKDIQRALKKRRSAA